MKGGATAIRRADGTFAEVPNNLPPNREESGISRTPNQSDGNRKENSDAPATDVHIPTT
jgi:hypothetical protein